MPSRTGPVSRSQQGGDTTMDQKPRIRDDEVGGSNPLVPKVNEVTGNPLRKQIACLTESWSSRLT
jgi:hypothetical protein